MRSSDLKLKRAYLIIVTLLALVVPLIQISVDSINLSQLIAETSQGLLLEPVITGPSSPSELHIVESEPMIDLKTVYLFGVILGSAVLLFSFLKILFQGFRSTKKRIHGVMVLQSPYADQSFSFFQWVFSNDDHPAILAHERAHIELGHTYDLILFNVNRVLFWWNPVMWWVLKEIKLIHEYQADQIAAESQDESSIESYSLRLH